VAQLVEEMIAAWQCKERPGAEQFLARHPELSNRPECALRLIYEEICQRHEAGLEVVTEEVIQRFPQYRAELEILLASDAFILNSHSAPALPKAGETIEGFKLLAELGRGSQGVVFVATQVALADRLVVVKVTAHDGFEHLSLARLQHTHIVPLYFAQDIPSRDLRILCMPYLGGGTFSKILATLAPKLADQRTGQDFLAALDQTQVAAPALTAPFAKGPVRLFLARSSYVQAICWMGSCLAEALHYAHQRGLVHLDLKPSNILLAADAQPMLLDFNLSQGPLLAETKVPERFGGTVDFMSPEQKLALAAFRVGKSVPTLVDGRSDIFSLGLILYESLGGNLEAAEGPLLPPVHLCNSKVTPGLSDIIKKCLEKDPAHRYQDAEELAADLRRHLADLPLQGVANRSLKESWHKWRRRRPHALALTGLLLGLLALGLTLAGISLAHVRERYREGQTALHEGGERLKNREYSEAVRTLTRGLALTDGISGSSDLRSDLHQQLHLAQRALLAQDLHLLADRMRFLVEGNSLSPLEMGELESQFWILWEIRDQITDNGYLPLDSDIEQRIQWDMLDLAVLFTHLRVRLAPAEQIQIAHQEALQVLDQAEAIFGPSPVLYRERQTHAEALGWKEHAQSATERALHLAPRTCWEHYSLGLFHFRSKNLTRAAAEFQRAVEMQPDAFWPNFYQGKCAYRLQHWDQALAAFSICIALAPEDGHSYYNRALVYTALRQPDRAIHDYGLALERSPKLASAALNRGTLLYQRNQLAEAATDFRRALACGADPATTLYNLALVQLAQKDRLAAVVSLEQALRQNPDHNEARELRERLQGRR
jgi:serine/threonine protein kinase/Tfp pilus assembly protein PilF